MPGPFVSVGLIQAALVDGRGNDAEDRIAMAPQTLIGRDFQPGSRRGSGPH